jgi:hypothetical protein
MKRYSLGIFPIWRSPPTAIGAIHIQGNSAAQCKQTQVLNPPIRLGADFPLVPSAPNLGGQLLCLAISSH